MNFTFKKHPQETGLASIGSGRSVDIKLNKKRCGLLNAPNWRIKDNKWYVSVVVKKKKKEMKAEPNCTWKWLKFAKKFKDEAEARLWVKERLEKAIIKNKRKLHFFD